MIRSRRLIAALTSALLLTTPVHAGDLLSDLSKTVLKQDGAKLSESDIAAGLKQALAKGTKAAVNELGRTDGYWGSQYQIPLPGAVRDIQGVLKSAGMGAQVEELHLTVNRAAEKAVPIAADVFSEAVQKLTLKDVRDILNGPDDAATQYFKRTTSDTLAARFKPTVAKVTSQLGLVQQYNAALSAAGPLASMLGGQNTDLDSYVTQKALDGLFLRVAAEEKAIRSDPAARTTDLLKKVFGSK